MHKGKSEENSKAMVQQSKFKKKGFFPNNALFI